MKILVSECDDCYFCDHDSSMYVCDLQKQSVWKYDTRHQFKTCPLKMDSVTVELVDD